MSVEILARKGRLRAAINLGNPVLAQRTAEGELAGVSVALAGALAKREGLALELVPYDGAGKVVDAAVTDSWDVAFLAIDPKRATLIAFTRPYVTIDGVFIVAKDSPWRDIADLDRPGVRISVGRGAAYDLHLTRALKHAELVRVPTSAEALPYFVANGLEAGAGIRQSASAFIAAYPGVRLIEEPFMQIRQAMAVPVAKIQLVARLQSFLDDAVETGLVANELSAWSAL